MPASTNDDWRTDWSDLDSALNEARKEARFTDIQFVMGEGTSKREFHAHKAILACRSPVFEKLFYGALAEKRSVIGTDDDPEAFEMLLSYIYGNKNSWLSLASAWKFFTLGDKYLVPKIQEATKNYINSVTLKEDDFWDIIHQDIFSRPLFVEKVNSYMIENTKKVIESANFLNVPENFLDNLLKSDKLNIQEFQLLLAATKWGFGNQQVNSEDMLKFYKRIRFSTLTRDEFFQFVDDYPKAMDAQNNLEILLHLHSPSSRNLPKWCSTSKASRFEEYEQHQRKENFAAISFSEDSYDVK